MKTGMLWFDNSKSPLSEKVSKAADYYEKKYQVKPNHCEVNPAQAETVQQVGGVTVKASKSILVNHLWIGVEDRNDRE